VKNPGNKDPVTGIDYTIVNPGKLEPRLREAVCQQCHLEGEARIIRRGRGLFDFRPGLPLESFLSVYVQKTEDGKDGRAVNHVEQMYSSHCFKATAGKDQLGCISCHNPHAPPEKRVKHFRQACLKCHRENTAAKVGHPGKEPFASPCSQPVEMRKLTSKQDCCVDCHMQRFKPKDIVHVAQTDHRILKVPENDMEATHERRRGFSLVNFHRGPVDLLDKEQARDFALALIRGSMSGEVDPRPMHAQALLIIQRILPAFPDDMSLWMAKAHTLELQGRGTEALAAWETVLAKKPDTEEALVGAARLSRSAGSLEAALGYQKKAVEVSPWRAGYRADLVRMLVQAQNWKECRDQSRAWLDLDPGSPESRQFLIAALLRCGQEAPAREEFRRLLALEPVDAHRIRAWFEQELLAAAEKPAK
jgi:Flp pilus assembly protein TadD